MVTTKTIAGSTENAVVNEDLEVQDIRSGTDNEHSPDRSGSECSCVHDISS